MVVMISENVGWVKVTKPNTNVGWVQVMKPNTNVGWVQVMKPNGNKGEVGFRFAHPTYDSHVLLNPQSAEDSPAPELIRNN